MAGYGTVYVDAVAESGRDPVSKHQPIRFSLSVENERADVGRDGRAGLARPNYQARMGHREKEEEKILLRWPRAGLTIIPG